MKTIAVALSLLSILSISAGAENLADFIAQEKVYTVRLVDGQIYHGVKFREWRSETDWGHISYERHRNASSSLNRPLPQALEIRPSPGTAWINFNQVTSIHEIEPSEEAAGETSETEVTHDKGDVSFLNLRVGDGEVDAIEGDTGGNQGIQWFPEEPVGFGEESENVVVSVAVGVESEDNDRQDGLEAVASGALVGGKAGALIGAIQNPDHLIQGAWEFEMNEETRAIKIIANGRWDVTHFDRGTGKVIINHGGSYAFDGKLYVEHVEYANENTTGLVGQKHRFELTIDGDVIHQKGVENPWTEDWVRVKR